MLAGAARPVTDRVLLARLAEQVIAASGAVRATAGRDQCWATADGDRVIEGVVVAESALGQVDVHLHLVADWPPEPLQQLAAQLRRQLWRSAASTGLDDRLGDTDVAIHDVRAPSQDAEIG